MSPKERFHILGGYIDGHIPQRGTVRACFDHRRIASNRPRVILQVLHVCLGGCGQHLIILPIILYLHHQGIFIHQLISIGL